MQHTDEIMEYYEQEQPLNIKEFLFKILSKWYWFAICGFLGLSIAWIHNRYSASIWQVETSILVSDGSKSPGVENLFASLNLGKTVNMDNHIGLLKSYNLNRQTIENLDWRTSWFGDGRFVDQEYYDNEPYKLAEPAGEFTPESEINSAYIPLYVTVLSDDRYLIECKYDLKTEGGKAGCPFCHTPLPFYTFKRARKSETRHNVLFLV